MKRRTFLATSGSCAAHLAALSAFPSARRLFAAAPARPVTAQEPWGRIEQVADNVWALISTPLSGGENAMRTIANGGIVAGRDGTAVVEGLASNEGAAWLANAATALTGRAPTHVILTHYHGDHSGGLAGFDRPVTFVTTEATRSRLRQSASQQPRWEPVVEALESSRLVGASAERLDLGGVELTITPRAGHTASDLTVTVAEPRVVFGGDLLWNGMIPNYRDAIPSQLSESVRALLADEEATFVPGHGSIPNRAGLQDYVTLLDDLEAAARRAVEAGITAEEAARDYWPPGALAEWTLFNPAYFQVALSAWERELNN